MSLIQKALEREGPSIFEQASARAGMPLAESRESLQKLEQKIEAIERKTRKATRAPWLMAIFSLAVFIGGIFWVYHFAFRVPDGTDQPAVSTEVFRPFPSPSRTPNAPGLNLTGITESGGVRYALINNQVVTVGDMLRKENAVVREIAPKSAIVECRGRKITLNLD